MGIPAESPAGFSLSSSSRRAIKSGLLPAVESLRSVRSFFRSATFSAAYSAMIGLLRIS